jgi:actin, other eukaryote
MTEIWKHAIYIKLNATSLEKHPVMMSEDLGNTRENREKTAQIMFENFKIPSFFLEQSSVLEMCSSGRTTGVLLNMGHTKNDVSCIYDGIVLPKTETSYLAGRDLDEHFCDLLNQSGVKLSRKNNHDIFKNIKEKVCYVRFSDSIEKGVKNYELPDGKVITIGNERYEATEILFDKYQIGKELSIQEIVSKCIQSKDVELQDEFFKNIVLAGGGSLFEGISERFEAELKPYYSKKVKVFSPPDRKYSNWIGASILSSISSFQSKWITKEQYQEYGSKIINYYCFNNVEVKHQIRKSSNLSKNLQTMKSKLQQTNIQFQFRL